MPGRPGFYDTRVTRFLFSRRNYFKKFSPSEVLYFTSGLLLRILVLFFLGHFNFFSNMFPSTQVYGL